MRRTENARCVEVDDRQRQRQQHGTKASTLHRNTRRIDVPLKFENDINRRREQIHNEKQQREVREESKCYPTV